MLSHLAILARELGVPTVVGATDALERFPIGSVVVVDGATGEVSAVETAGAAAATRAPAAATGGAATGAATP